MRIAMLGHKHIPSREGGIEVVVEELSSRMVRQGHDVTCYNRSSHHVNGREYDNWNQTEYRGIELKTVFTIDQKGLAAVSSSFFATIKAVFARRKYDVIHFHAEGSCTMLWLARLLRRRCIVTVHGLDHQRAKWGRFARAYILLGEKTAVRFADEIIVLSRSAQDYFLQTYHRKTRLIPNGIDPPDITAPELIRHQWGLEKENYILFVGRLVPEKGISYLIEAFKQTRTAKKLVIAGGASDTENFADELKRLSQGDSRILFTGFVQGKALKELYSNTYLYVLPSDLEGMPVSLLEAMSYGNCCLVSDIPECLETAGGKAVVFRKGSISDLNEKLQALCDDEAVVRCCRTGISDYVCRKYSWDNAVRQTLELYAGEGG